VFPLSSFPILILLPILLRLQFSIGIHTESGVAMFNEEDLPNSMEGEIEGTVWGCLMDLGKRPPVFKLLLLPMLSFCRLSLISSF
jgi:hypothetical protein